MKRDISRKGDDLLNERKELRYDIQQHSEEWRITLLRDVLQVSRSGFHA